MEKVKTLNRKKDVVCTILSYPPFNRRITPEQVRHGSWIRRVLKINRKLRELKLSPKKKERYILERLYHKITKLLNHSIVDIEASVPRWIIDEMHEESICYSKPKKEVHNLAFDFVLRQLLEAIHDPYFQIIGFYGSDDAPVFMPRLKNLPQIRAMFDIVIYVNVKSCYNIGDIEESTKRVLGLSTSRNQQVNELLRSKNFLILLDGVSSRLNIYQVGTNWWNPEKIQKIFSIHGLGEVDSFAVDLEIRLKDHLSSWKFFCRDVGEVVHSSSIQGPALHVFRRICDHFLATALIARALKGVQNPRIWEYAAHTLDLLMPETGERILFNALAFVCGRLGLKDKYVKYCVSCLEWGGMDKVDLIESWIKDGLVGTRNEGEEIVQDLVSAFLLESSQNGDCIRMRFEICWELGNLFKTKMNPMLLELDGRELMEVPRDAAWEEASEMHLMNNKISKLPENPNCPRLNVLCLQVNHHLRVIPQFFFARMPILQIIDLSHTRIRTLPQSLFKLVLLRKLFLKGCELFKELPPEIGELLHLQVLDLEGSDIINLPITVGKLQNLTCLKVSFCGPNKHNRKKIEPNRIIPKELISNLLQLEELSIDVNPDDEGWNTTAKHIIMEVCRLKWLKVLKLYFPEVVLLNELRNGTSSRNLSLRNFRFVVGSCLNRMISRLPPETAVKFEKQERSLKYVNGEGVPTGIKDVLQHATALFLDRHLTVASLTEFGIGNMQNLKFCLLGECHEIQTIVDAVNEEIVLGSLKYLNLHYMKNLRSIWKGPFRQGSLSKLKSLVVQTCPQLNTIFKIDLLRSIFTLEELVVEDCPEIKCIVSHEVTAEDLNSMLSYLPRLKSISLHYMPNLESISGGLPIAPQLEWISLYDCPNVRTLSEKEVSSDKLKVILGEADWWSALKWKKSEQFQPSNLNSLFVPIERDKDLKTQLVEIHVQLQAGRQQIQPYPQSVLMQ